MKSVTESISHKLANKEELNVDEQYILKEELKVAKARIWLSRLSVALIIFIEIVFFAYIGYRVVLGLNAIGAVDNTPHKPHVAILNLDKPITDKYADMFNTKLIELSNEKNVKSIVVRLRSPGGTPSASWNIATTIKDIQEKETKPLYIYVDSAAVSGSYMIASQSDRIFANRFSMVGSIGVIIEHLVVEDLAKKVGVGQETLTAGKYKKFLSFFKYLNEEQKKYIEDNLLNVVYDQFIDVVAKGRKISIEKLQEYAEGRIFIASDEKVKNTLVDQVIDWPVFKDLIKKERSLPADTLFNIYEVKPKKGGLDIIGSELDLNLNLDMESQNKLNFK